jgi:16S rRNA (adenine1518-N6/adenine1519-N6)-dimethyltransferase
MVQKEFAERMTAKPNSKEYGRFTLFVCYYSQAHYQFTIKPSCFYPAPKVHSALVTCSLQAPLLKSREESALFDLTRTVFAQRRKMLRSTLKSLYPIEKIDAVLMQLGIDLKVRPEMLSLEQFIELFKLCDEK